MKIQTIQSTNNINHKARFIDDKNVYFRNIWQDTIINDFFGKTVNRFYNSNA